MLSTVLFEFERLIKKTYCISWEIEPYIRYELNYNGINKEYLIDIYYNDREKGIKDEIHREIDIKGFKGKTALSHARYLVLWFSDFIDIFVNKYHSGNEDKVQE